MFVPGLDYRVFEAALLLNIGARLPVRGMTMYQTEDAGGLAPNWMAALMATMVTKRLDPGACKAAHDFTQLAPESIRDPDFIADMGMLLRSGQLRYRGEFVDGLENAPAALESVLRGGNFGKLALRVA